MSAMTNIYENRLIDFLFRGQTLAVGSGLFIGLLTAAPSDAGGGTEVSGGAYARVALAPSLTNWAGTQAAGSTAVSSGTSGTTSNNVAITFPEPTANWGVVTHFGIFDQPTGGNLIFFGTLGTAKTINNGDAAPSFVPGALTVQIDD